MALAQASGCRPPAGLRPAQGAAAFWAGFWLELPGEDLRVKWGVGVWPARHKARCACSLVGRAGHR